MEEKTTEKSVAVIGDRERREKRAERKRKLRETSVALKAVQDAVFSRQPSAEEEDAFTQLYDKHRLMEPPYDFNSLWRIYEESDVLQECIDAYIQNIDGFGFQMLFLGEDVTQRRSAESIRQEAKGTDFFNFANETQSWTSVRKLMREDLEVLGNGCLELVRSKTGKLQMAYYLPFKKIRVSALDGRAITVYATIRRDGEVVKVPVKKYFRKYCAVNITTGLKMRWFKSFGDPRFLDATTGEYKSSADACKMVASELLHFRLPHGGAAYGVPRWISVVLEAMGRRSAQYVNYDLFQSQGIPPMVIMVSNGVLTDESYDEIETLIRGMRGVEQWNKIAILESNVDSVGMEEKGSAKIELKNLAEWRSSDMMFRNYLDGAERAIRHRYRLPPLYTGGAETFTHATAKAAQTVAEEQVFIPERQGFDEEVNRKIVMPELGIDLWSFRSKGPRVVNSEEITKGVRVFQQAGALTVNHAIDLANRAFGLEMSKYPDEWADYPMALVIELIKSGRLKGMEAIDEGPPEPVNVTPPQKLLPAKVLKSDMFNDEEKSIYKKLVFLQDAIDRGLSEGLIDTDDVQEAV